MLIAPPPRKWRLLVSCRAFNQDQQDACRDFLSRVTEPVYSKSVKRSAQLTVKSSVSWKRHRGIEYRLFLSCTVTLKLGTCLLPQGDLVMQTSSWDIPCICVQNHILHQEVSDRVQYKALPLDRAPSKLSPGMPRPPRASPCMAW